MPYFSTVSTLPLQPARASIDTIGVHDDRPLFRKPATEPALDTKLEAAGVSVIGDPPAHFGSELRVRPHQEATNPLIGPLIRWFLLSSASAPIASGSGSSV